MTTDFRRISERLRATRAVRQIWQEFRSAFLVAATSVFAGATVVAFVEWRKVVRDNQSIASLRDGRDVTVDLSARAELLVARAAFFAERGDADRARSFVEAADRRIQPKIAAQGRYVLANALLRKAFDLIERGELDAAGPHVILARREYRRVLQLVPEHWDAKYNLDVATRLVRDFPQFEPKDGDELYADPKKLWTDIPGAPKGLP